MMLVLSYCAGFFSCFSCQIPVTLCLKQTVGTMFWASKGLGGRVHQLICHSRLTKALRSLVRDFRHNCGFCARSRQPYFTAERVDTVTWLQPPAGRTRCSHSAWWLGTGKHLPQTYDLRCQEEAHGWRRGWDRELQSACRSVFLVKTLNPRLLPMLHNQCVNGVLTLSLTNATLTAVYQRVNGRSALKSHCFFLNNLH